MIDGHVSSLISDIIRDSTDSIEVELEKDGTWHVTKTEEADTPSPCASPLPNIQNGMFTRTFPCTLSHMCFGPMYPCICASPLVSFLVCVSVPFLVFEPVHFLVSYLVCVPIILYSFSFYPSWYMLVPFIISFMLYVGPLHFIFSGKC